MIRRQYGKLEICGPSPGYDTNFSLKNYHLYSGCNQCGQTFISSLHFINRDIQVVRDIRAILLTVVGDG